MLEFFNFCSRKEERIESLQDIYEVTKRLENLALFCLFANCKLINFKEAVQEKKKREPQWMKKLRR